MVQVVNGKDKLALLLLHPKTFMDMDAARDKADPKTVPTEQMLNGRIAASSCF